APAPLVDATPGEQGSQLFESKPSSGAIGEALECRNDVVEINELLPPGVDELRRNLQSLERLPRRSGLLDDVEGVGAQRGTVSLGRPPFDQRQRGCQLRFGALDLVKIRTSLVVRTRTAGHRRQEYGHRGRASRTPFFGKFGGPQRATCRCGSRGWRGGGPAGGGPCRAGPGRAAGRGRTRARRACR